MTIIINNICYELKLFMQIFVTYSYCDFGRWQFHPKSVLVLKKLLKSLMSATLLLGFFITLTTVAYTVTVAVKCSGALQTTFTISLACGPEWVTYLPVGQSPSFAESPRSSKEPDDSPDESLT